MTDIKKRCKVTVLDLKKKKKKCYAQNRKYWSFGAQS